MVNKIKGYRNMLGLSQEQLGKQLGISKLITIKKVEKILFLILKS